MLNLTLAAIAFVAPEGAQRCFDHSTRTAVPLALTISMLPLLPMTS
jgi:hypothetical protein